MSSSPRSSPGTLIMGISTLRGLVGFGDTTIEGACDGGFTIAPLLKSNSMSPGRFIFGIEGREVFALFG